MHQELEEVIVIDPEAGNFISVSDFIPPRFTKEEVAIEDWRPFLTSPKQDVLAVEFFTEVEEEELKERLVKDGGSVKTITAAELLELALHTIGQLP